MQVPKNSQLNTGWRGDKKKKKGLVFLGPLKLFFLLLFFLYQ
jgi:hypothetical protein